MKKKNCIFWLLAGATALFLTTHSMAVAADKLVVVPLFTSKTPTVTSATGRIWMDRNLGALRVATKSADPDTYGSLYQWGRLDDGHEYRASGTTSTLSSGIIPGHDDFIMTSSSPYDWIFPQENGLWQGVSGINNPCPAGFRLPTETEWEAERTSWGSNNPEGAFNSPLKLVVAGYRNRTNGELRFAGSDGLYWSSTINGGYARCLHFPSGSASMVNQRRAYGMSVRCIKD